MPKIVCLCVAAMAAVVLSGCGAAVTPTATTVPPTATLTATPRPTLAPTPTAPATATAAPPPTASPTPLNAPFQPSGHVARTACLSCHLNMPKPQLPTYHLGRTEAECPRCHASPLPPAGSPLLYALATRTGVEDLDAVVQAFVTNDASARRRLVRYLTTPCTTAQGAGGPPKCAAGEPNGTPVTVFPFLGSEGEFVRQEGIDRVLQFDVLGLYGVYRAPQTSATATYWPAGQYAVVLVCADELPTIKGMRQQAVLYVEGGAVVRIARSPLRAAWPPDEAAGAIWLLAPRP